MTEIRDLPSQPPAPTPTADQIDEQGAATTADQLAVPAPNLPTSQAAPVEPNILLGVDGQPTSGLDSVTFQPDNANEGAETDTLLFIETEDRQSEVAPNLFRATVCD